MIKNVKIVIIWPLNQSFTNIPSLPKNYSTDLSHSASVQFLRIAYLWKKKLVTIKHFLVIITDVALRMVLI